MLAPTKRRHLENLKLIFGWLGLTHTDLLKFDLCLVMFMFETIEVWDVYGNVSFMSEWNFDFAFRDLTVPGLDGMFGLIIHYFYLISSLSAGRFYVVNTRDNEILRNVKNIDFKKASDNSLADYKDGFEMRIVQSRKYQKFQNFIKNNPELWKDAKEITKQTLINFLQFQYNRNSMLEERWKVLDGSAVQCGLN